MQQHSAVENEQGGRLETITFGPVSVLPEYQQKGIGSALIRHSIQKAREAGHSAIVIY